MSRIPCLVLLWVGLVGCGGLSSKPPQHQLASSEEISEISISGPFLDWIHNREENLYKPKKKEFKPVYKNVTILYGSQTIEAKMRLRGGVRFCDSFPHFKLKLPKTQRILDQREFKIVSHGYFEEEKLGSIHAPNCGDELSSWDPSDVYKREYELYKIQEELLTYSLNVFPAIPGQNT